MPERQWSLVTLRAMVQQLRDMVTITRGLRLPQAETHLKTAIHEMEAAADLVSAAERERSPQDRS
ncbi:hypothetical protein [Consotaella salsifontis]|uniref:Uncharacterized protein n=1 Tax=Consotaella salsifontis TaxID=1365950 RepID=A0A1T4TFE2_9HYPH|nr:hypothetical protein [Consotaella salsifontis]SKA38998.1 hypothetical protein SAMN05428963_12713 [Consotaella salsifontis]